MLKTTAAALLAAMLISSAASAQSSFDGVYVGANGNNTLGVVETGTGDFQGFGAGAFVGYGTSFDTIYLGIEAGADYANTEFSGTESGVSYDATRRYSGSLQARLGYLPSEESLLFLSGGLGYTNYEVRDGSTSEEWVDSYRFGLGAEQSLSNEAFARVSYDLDIQREAREFNPVDLQTRSQTVRVGLGFRF